MSDNLSYLKQEMSRLQIENRALREEVLSLREYVSALQALMDAVDELDPKSEIMPLLDRILMNAMAVTNSSDGSLMVVDDETQELVFILARGKVSPQHLIGQRIPPGKGIAGWVAKNAQPAITNAARTDARFYPGIDDAFKFITNAVLAAPIIGHGRVLGVIEVLNKHNNKLYQPADQTLLVLLCRFAGEILFTMTQQEEGQSAPAKPAQG